jgi:type II secretory pathway pseudopilin PulG
MKLTWSTIKNQGAKGFTLVEFILILSIFSIMAGVTMFNFNGFRSNIAMENLAYDVALSIQGIQQRAASGFNSGTGSASVATGQFQGIQFTKLTGGGFSSEFILFKDIVTQNQRYDSGSVELIDKIKIQYSEYVKTIEYNSTNNFSTGATILNNDVAILFKRPWLDAYFYDLPPGTGAGNLLNPNAAQYVRITLATGGTISDPCGTNGVLCKYVIISRAGQVSVK